MQGLMVKKIKEVKLSKNKGVVVEGSRRPKASKKKEAWEVLPRKKDLWKKKGKKPSNTPEQPHRARPEAVFIKPAEGISYATILFELKKRVNPDELGATVQGINETRSKD